MADRAGVSLSIRPEGLKDVQRKMAHAVTLAKKPSVLMKRIAAVLEGSTRRRFRSGLAPDGKAWKKSARVLEKGGSTLFEHGHLEGSITADADDTHAEVGTNIIYGRIHQLGGVIKAKGGGFLKFNIPGIGWRMVRKVTIPARPYLGVSNDDRTELAEQTSRFIGEMFA
jgi:phage virion morphogenesis protein